MFARWNNREKKNPFPEKVTFRLAEGTTIGGVVVDEDGKPLANVSAELVPFGKYDDDYTTIFTNKGGYFYAYGLKPGSYKLFLDSDKYEPIIVRIARNTKEGYCKLGTLKAK